MVVCAFVAVKNKFYERLYFLFATVIACIGTLVAFGVIYGLIDFNVMTSSAFEIAAFVEISIISIAFRQRQKYAISAALLSATAELEQNYTFIEEQSASLDISRRRAEHANKVKSQFLATMSHEFRTPLNAILGFASQLKQEIDNVETVEHVDIIHESANNLRIIVNDLLDYSQIESGDIQLTPTTFSAAELLTDLVSQANREAENKSLELVYSQTVLPRRLTGDKDKIQQILHHILRNAIKFTHKGYLYINVSSRPIDDGNIELIIAVEDSGSGIDPERQKALFDESGTTSHTFSRSHQGAGLGLSISKKLCQMMDGTLSVQSQLQVGSIFTLVVPLGASHDLEVDELASDDQLTPIHLANFSQLHKRTVTQIMSQLNATLCETDCVENNNATVIWNESAKEPLSQEDISKISNMYPKSQVIISCISRTYLNFNGHSLPSNIEIQRKPLTIQKLLQVVTKCSQSAQQSANRPLNLSSLKLLAVDDMEMNLKLLETWLAPTNIQLKKALNGDRAISLCEEMDFDLILMDIQMPGMDGLQTTQAIRRGRNQGTPIIAVTAHAFEQEKIEFLQSGMDDHIAKPINLNGLMSIISSWCQISDINSHVDAIDWKHAVNRTQGDEALAEELFQLFKNELIALRPRIELADEKQNHSEMMSTIHAVHGIAMQTGVPRLQMLCDEIEGLLKQGYYDQAYRLMEQFYRACDEILTVKSLRDHAMND